MPWRDCLAFKVYNVSKIHMYGFLIQMVYETKTEYILNLKIRHGGGRRLQEIILLLENLFRRRNDIILKYFQS